MSAYTRAFLVQCKSCSITFAARPPTDQELEAYYRGYGHAWFDSPITRERYRDLLDGFEAYRRNNILLDVGCGAGFFLEEARARGWDVAGSEYSEHALGLARGKGLQVARAPLTRDVFAPDTFDVVTAFEVFEHVRDPRHEAMVISHVLRVGGLLYCTTPNFNSLSRRLLGPRWSVINYPEHLWYFTPRTLRGWLERSGFLAEEITTSGISPAGFRRGLCRRSAQAQPPATNDQDLRDAIERSGSLRLAKTVVNAALGALDAGDTIKAWFRLDVQA